jgi:hypothetical protein
MAVLPTEMARPKLNSAVSINKGSSLLGFMYRVPFTRKELSAPLNSRDQLRQGHLQSHGDFEQRPNSTVGPTLLEFCERISTHTGLMRQRLLGQVPRFAARPNFVTQRLQDRTCAHATRFDP